MRKPIRILQFPGAMLFGGVGSVVMNLYRNIDKTKIQFDFCVPRNSRAPLDDEIESMGGRIFYIPQMREKGIGQYITSIRRIIRENGAYMYAHIHSIHMGAVTAMAVRKEGVKVFYHVHNTQDPALNHMPLHKCLEYILKKYIQNKSYQRLACGRMAGQYIYGSKPFIIINNAVDLNVFYPYDSNKKSAIRRQLGFTDDDIVVGDIARFASVKNIHFFLRLAIEDRTGMNKLKFLLVGDGEEKRNIEDSIKKQCLMDKFLLTGSRKDVDMLYNAMDVFCLPSFFEGLPVSLMEAQAVGLPCVISDTITQEGVVGASKVLTLSLTENVSKWVTSIYELSSLQVFDSQMLFEKFSSKKYEIGSIAKQVEMLYLNSL